MEKRFVNSLRAKSIGLISPVLISAAIVFCLPLQSAAQTGAKTKLRVNATATKDWTGSYSFADQAAAPKPRRQTDVVPFTEYSITVTPRRGNQLTATLEVSGIQQFELYECSVKVTDGKAEFFFERAGDAESGVNNQSRFKKGELMFTLVKAKIGGQTTYLFQNQAYKIKRLSAGKQNVVFEKR